MPFVRKPTTPAAPPASSSEDDGASVLARLRSADPDERWSAARSAATVTGGAAALATALRVETDPHIRAALFTGLARVGTAQGSTELLNLLRSDQSSLRTGALDALRTLGAGLHELLPQLLSDADADIRILSCELARALPAEEASTLLCNLLAGEQDVNVCAAAVDVLAEVGTPDACPVLARCAARFARSPFLGFAVKTATDRINSASAPARD
jgi:HEAT repeat protein